MLKLLQGAQFPAVASRPRSEGCVARRIRSSLFKKINVVFKTGAKESVEVYAIVGGSQLPTSTPPPVSPTFPVRTRMPVAAGTKPKRREARREVLLRKRQLRYPTWRQRSPGAPVGSAITADCRGGRRW
jgi:hypothetical protein